jgi:hypothetical protein
MIFIDVIILYLCYRYLKEREDGQKEKKERKIFMI